MGQIAHLRKKSLNNKQAGAKVMIIQAGWFKVAIPLKLPYKRGVAFHLNKLESPSHKDVVQIGEEDENVKC